MEKSLKLNSNDEAIALYGPLDENLRYVEREFQVKISARNHRLKIVGKKGGVESAHRYFQAQLKQLRTGSSRHSRDGQDGGNGSPVRNHARGGSAAFTHRGKTIRGKTHNQEVYLKALAASDIVVSIGPAGTGKTYLAMASAIAHLKDKLVGRIILTRPAVEAGESLGFLPGDLQEKVNPYLRPLYDALYDMMDYEDAMRYLEKGVIEVAPLAYMRGRTLNDSFIILDEAQNCTHTQMKMFLTRLGQNSKAVLTGDVTQIDLPRGSRSGLVETQTILKPIKGITFVYLSEKDVVRHPLVQDIITAYEKHEYREQNKPRT